MRITEEDEYGISVVVPVFNSRATLSELVTRIATALSSVARYEVILVDDGSADGSADEISRLALEQPQVRGIFLIRNFGQHNALLAGIRDARFPVTVTLDDDLQNPPEDILRLVEKLAGGDDVIYGVASRGQHDLWRRVASRTIRAALRGAIGRRHAAMVSTFRAFRTDVRRAFENYRSASVSVDVLLAWGSSRFDSVAVGHSARRSGRSQYSLVKLMSQAINMMTGYSTWPLRLASVIGFFFTLFGIGVLAYVVVRYLVAGGSVPGFPFLASIIAIFSGAQLFALGIMGEYLAKMHGRMMDRPPYVIGSRSGDSGHHARVSAQSD